MRTPAGTSLCGWRGRALHVDLERRQWQETPLPETLLRQCLGGRGLAGWLLQEALPQSLAPLVLAAGPLAAGVLPMACRAVVSTVSPLTGTVRHAPAGGRLALALQRAGWDAVIMTGQSPEPVTVRIEGEAVHFDAPPSASSNPSLPSSAALLRAGPAAWAGSPLATLLDEAGRPVAAAAGLGLACAQRHLAAVLVDGRLPLQVHDRAALGRVRRVFLRLIHASPALAGATGVGRYGDGTFFDLLQARRMLPGRNFRTLEPPGAEPLGAMAYAATHGVGCTACPTPCGRRTGVALTPDLRAMAGWSVLTGWDNTSLVLAAWQRCQDLGLDVWEAAAAVAGHLEKSGVAGEACSTPQLLALLDVLGRGDSLDVAPDMNSDALMRVKGMALPCLDPRGAWGLALALAVGSQGPDPEACVVWHQEILRKPVAVDRFSWSGKARLVARGEDAAAVAQSLGLCSLGLAALGLEELAQALAAVTGWNASAGTLAACGAAMVDRERRLHCAIAPKLEDDLPARCFAPLAVEAGRVPIPVLDRRAFLEERGKYYRIRGWDATGCPAGMEDVGDVALKDGGNAHA